MKRFDAFAKTVTDWLSGLSRRAKWSTAAALVAASALGGASLGLWDSQIGLQAAARSLERSEREIALVEQVQVLADLDARSDGPWDRFETERRTVGIVKGGMIRYFGSPVPRIDNSERGGAYAMTEAFDVDICRRPWRILSAGPLARRIEVSVRDANSRGMPVWQPANATPDPCGWQRLEGMARFRIAPRTKAADAGPGAGSLVAASGTDRPQAPHDR